MIAMHQEPNLELGEGVFVILFHARWCGTCRSVTRHLTELEDEMGFRGVLVDVELLPLVTKGFRIKGVPILVITKDGIEIDRVGGSLTKIELRQWLLESNVI
ncbi:MAG: thioredoxin family protein [Candidatus Izemoplasmatales bacterium]|jgi:thioredoxin-like negative regulator of GroEL